METSSCETAVFQEGFVVESELGRGATGVVYKIVTRSSKQTFAMKRMGLKHLSLPQRVQKLREVQALESLSHPNVIRDIDARIVGSDLCLIMEFAAHGDLAQVIARQKEKKRFLAEGFVWNTLWQICLGLLYLHSHNVIHRDIKPLNILLCKDPVLSSHFVVKLGDLADTKPISRPEDRQKLAGTPLYLAPELVRGDQRYDGRVDIWALGCVLYELLTLSCPFSGDNPQELFHSIEHCHPRPIASSYSKRLRELCMKLLDKSKESRPQIDEVVGMFPPPYSVGNSVVDEENFNSYALVKARCRLGQTSPSSPTFAGLASKPAHHRNTSFHDALNALKNEILNKTETKKGHSGQSSVKNLLCLARKEAEESKSPPKSLINVSANLSGATFDLTSTETKPGASFKGKYRMKVPPLRIAKIIQRYSSDHLDEQLVNARKNIVALLRKKKPPDP